MRRVIGLSVFSAVVALTAGHAGAQAVNPGVVLPPSANPDLINEEQRRRLEEASRSPLVAPKTPAIETQQRPETAAPEGATLRFRLTAVTFDPSAYLSAVELAALAAPKIGHEVTLVDLQALVEAVNALYTARGAATARAVLPAQDVADGCVKIRLIEGRIGTVTVKGGSKRAAADAARRGGLATGSLADPRLLEARLRRYNLGHDGQLRASLAAGDDFGTTDLLLAMETPDRVTIDAFADNGGFTSTGRLEEGAIVRGYRLLRPDDRLSGVFVRSSGVLSASGDYNVPLGNVLRLDLSSAYGRTHVQSSALGSLDVRGTSLSFGASVTALLIAGPRLTVTTSAAFQNTNSQTTIAGRSVTDNGENAVSVSLNIGYALPGISLSVQQEVAYSPVRERVSGTQVNPVIFRGSAALRKVLLPRVQALLRADYQIATTNDLPGILQFQIGGTRTTRAFSPGTAAGDKGLDAAVELSYAATVGAANLQPFVFIDHAQVQGMLPFASLQSGGTGLNLTLGDRLNVRASYGTGFGHRGIAANERRAFFTANLRL